MTIPITDELRDALDLEGEAENAAADAYFDPTPDNRAKADALQAMTDDALAALHRVTRTVWGPYCESGCGFGGCNA